MREEKLVQPKPAVPGAATAGAAAAPVSAGVPAAGDSPGMAPFAAPVSRASEAVFSWVSSYLLLSWVFFTPTPQPPPTYLLRGPLGRSKPDLPTYCIGSNGSQQTPYLARSRNPGLPAVEPALRMLEESERDFAEGGAELLPPPSLAASLGSAPEPHPAPTVA